MNNDMVKIVVVKNPFNPSQNREVIVENTGKSLAHYIDHHVRVFDSPNDVYIDIDGTRVEDYDTQKVQILDKECLIVVCPVVGKGKSAKMIIGLVATIGLAIVTGGIAAGTYLTHLTALQASLVAAGISMVGGLLINKLCYKQDQGLNNRDLEQNPTYGFQGVQTLETQGNPVQLTYGKVKAGGQTLQRYVTSSGSNQWLHWLIACGEGAEGYEGEYEVDREVGEDEEFIISDIRINNNPVSTYTDINIETRSGSNDQAIIENFGDSYTPALVTAQSLDTNNEWRTQQFGVGDSTEGIRVTIEFSNGLYSMNDKGGVVSAWVNITIQYAKTGTNDWKNLYVGRITKATNSPYRESFQVDHIEKANYTVRLMITGRSHAVTSTRAAVRCNWVGLESVIYDDFVYPNTALVGVKVKATEQINGSQPNLSFLKERRYVWVWNPNTQDYERVKANNPAWASYDMACQIRRLKNPLYSPENHIYNEFEFVNRGVPKELMIYEQFKAWADWCDDINGKGDKLEVNLEVNQAKDWWSIVNNDIASVGRGLVIQEGTRYGCIYSHSQDAVQVFTSGNIKEGSFELSYLSTDDRADSLEITYFDKDKDYERTQLTVFASDYDHKELPNNPTQITMAGITSYEQAYREAKFQLFCNALMNRSITFKTDVEAISCQVGDVINVATNTVEWGISGRIDHTTSDTIGVYVDDEDWANLLTKIQQNNGQLTVMVSQVTQDENGKGKIETHTREVNSYSEEQNGKYLTLVIGQHTFNVDDMFVLGMGENALKPFTVTGIQRNKDLEYIINGLEYNPGCYNEDYTIPTPDTSIVTQQKAPQITNLKANQTVWVDAGGTVWGKLGVSWEFASADDIGRFSSLVDYFSVYLYSMSESRWIEAGTTTDINFSKDVPLNDISRVGVRATYVGNTSPMVEVVIPTVTQEEIDYVVDNDVNNIIKNITIKQLNSTGSLVTPENMKYDIRVEFDLAVGYLAFVSYTTDMYAKGDETEPQLLSSLSVLPNGKTDYGRTFCSIRDVRLGSTYYMRVNILKEDTLEQVTKFDTNHSWSPYIFEHTVTAKAEEKPDTPTYCKFEYRRGETYLVWDRVSNTDVGKYYITNSSALPIYDNTVLFTKENEINLTKLDRTTLARLLGQSQTTLNRARGRNITIYLWAEHIKQGDVSMYSHQWSDALKVELFIPSLPMPTVNYNLLNAKSFTISATNKFANAEKMLVEIKNNDKADSQYSTYETFDNFLTFTGGIAEYQFRVAYQDFIGTGSWFGPETIQITSDLDSEAMGILLQEKIQDLVDAGLKDTEEIKSIQARLEELTDGLPDGVSESINNINGELTIIKGNVTNTQQYVSVLQSGFDRLESTVSSAESTVSGYRERVSNLEQTAERITTTLYETADGLVDKSAILEYAVNGLKSDVYDKNGQSLIQQAANKIDLIVTNGKIDGEKLISFIEATPDNIYINSTKINFGNGLDAAMVIEDGTVTVEKLASKSVTAEKINVTELSAISAKVGVLVTYNRDRTQKAVNTGGCYSVYSREDRAPDNEEPESTVGWTLRTRNGMWE